MPRSALALRHVHFEDLGAFAPVLEAAGYVTHVLDAPGADLSAIDRLELDLLIVLGGPVGVGDVAAYPFLADEQAILRARLAAERPTLGVCLGAQLMATALGAAVVPSGSKEIGFSPVTLTEAGRAGPLRWLESVPVLHWHGDAFEIPPGAVRLASTGPCENQAFAIGRHALGLQFHPEIDAAALEPWLVGHAVELAIAGLDPVALRADGRRHAAALKAAGQGMLTEWLRGLAP